MTAPRIDWRTMFKGILIRMRESGESHEMGARWMATEADKAVHELMSAKDAEIKRLRVALDEIATTEEYRGLTAEEAMAVAKAALNEGETSPANNELAAALHWPFPL